MIQRVVVRMLHDPELRAAVYATGREALPEVALTDAEVAMLTRPDPRAWSVDPHRSDRVLAALLDELAATALALVADGARIASLYAFFRSPHFHEAIMARRSLVPAFADHLAWLATTERARSLLSLERAIAALRRVDPGGHEEPPVAGAMRISRRFSPIALAEGTLAAWEAVKKAVGDDASAALVAETRPRLAEVDPHAREWVLLELPAPGEPPLAGYVSDALGRLLQAAAQSVARARLTSIAVEEGASPAEAAEILDDLVADGLLIRRP